MFLSFSDCRLPTVLSKLVFSLPKNHSVTCYCYVSAILICKILASVFTFNKYTYMYTSNTLNLALIALPKGQGNIFHCLTTGRKNKFQCSPFSSRLHCWFLQLHQLLACAPQQNCQLLSQTKYSETIQIYAPTRGEVSTGLLYLSRAWLKLGYFHKEVA